MCLEPLGTVPRRWCVNALGRRLGVPCRGANGAMPSTKSSRVNPKYKQKYRVGNWRAYESGLRARGDVTVWFAEEALSAWTPPPTGCRGGQPRYSNLAILTALSLRMLFHLPLRQTEGFVASLLRLMGLDLNAPDHTTLSRRNRDVLVPALSRDDGGPIHLIVDSTGLKIYGAGEWCSSKHRTANERGGWRKLHLGVDDDGVAARDGALEAEKPAYREDRHNRKTGVAEGDRLPGAGPRRGHVPPVQTDPRRQSACEGVRSPAARSESGVHRAEQDVRTRDGAVLRGDGVIVGDFDTGSVPWSNHATKPRDARDRRRLPDERGVERLPGQVRGRQHAHPQ